MVDNKESFLDFAQRVTRRELTEFEKEMLGAIYECRKSGNRLLIIPSRYQGRCFVLSLIKMFEEEVN